MSGEVTNQIIDLAYEYGSYFTVQTSKAIVVGLYPLPTVRSFQNAGRGMITNVVVAGIENYGIHTSTWVTRVLAIDIELFVKRDDLSTELSLGAIRTIIQGTLWM